MRHDVIAGEVDRLLAEHERSFPPSIEAKFEEYRGDERRRHHILYGSAGIFLFVTYLLYDVVLIPDVFSTALLFRLGIVGPICAAVLLSLVLVRSGFYREFSQAIACTLVFATILYLSMISQSQFTIYYHFAAPLVILYSNVVQRIDFNFAVGTSLACFALSSAALFWNDGLPPQGIFAVMSILSGSIAITLFANWRMEGQLRQSYLLHLRETIRNDALDEMTLIDPLTGVGNRRQLDRYVRTLWERSPEELVPAAILICDVDHFKNYNDFFGHPAGDLCLKRIAAALSREATSAGHLTFRFGGEEFVIVMDNTELMDGVRFGEKLRAAILAEAIPHAASSGSDIVSLSIGVSASNPAGAITSEEAISSADNALYAAKRAGRNRVWPPIAGNLAVVTSLVARATTSVRIA